MGIGPSKTKKIKRDGGQRRALLVANGTYSFLRLPGVEKDLDVMRDLLADEGLGCFAVTCLLDKGLLEVRKAIAEICAKSGPDDTLLLYYSGASSKGADGSLFLPLADSDKEYPEATSLDAEFILGQFRRSNCRRFALLVDGCNSGAFFNNNRGIPDGLVAITACGPNESTADTPGGGAFTRALSAALRDPTTDRDGDGRITMDEAFDVLRLWLDKNGFKTTPQKWVWNVPEPIYLVSSPILVFLSYCRADVAIAEELEKLLKEAGFRVWLDLQGIHSGDWKQLVTEGINRARALVYILTPSSLKSEAARKELGFAAAKGLPILPVVPGAVAKEDLPDWYRFDYDSIHRIAIDMTSPADGIESLAKAIREAKPLRA
jgi:hypothetical protein